MKQILSGDPHRVWSLFVVGVGLLLVAVPARAQSESTPDSTGTCIACHRSPRFAVTHPKLFKYWLEFKASAHYRDGVSCVDCHGGNSDAPDAASAHRGILAPDSKKSPVYYDRISKTCGTCHSEIEAAYLTSRHAERLAEGKTAPNCVTCHGSVSAAAPSSASIGAVCGECHGISVDRPLNLVDRAIRVRRFQEMSQGYLTWLSRHDGEALPTGRLTELRAEADSIKIAWHTFDLEGIEAASQELLESLKEARSTTHKTESKNPD